MIGEEQLRGCEESKRLQRNYKGTTLQHPSLMLALLGVTNAAAPVLPHGRAIVQEKRSK